MPSLPAYDLAEVRRAFPLSERLTYLNHASISPVPLPTIQTMQQALQRLTEDPSTLYGDDPVLGNIAANFSAEMAALLHAASPDEIVPVQNTSIALNMIAHAVPWHTGDNVIFSRVEFPSNAYPWMALERFRVRPILVPDDGSGGPSVELFDRYVDAHTRVIAVSAVQFFTGHRADLAALGAYCRERGIWLVVDAIQAAGHMPIDVQAMQIDVLVSGGQKSLMGTPGQGLLYVREQVAEQMRPAIIGSHSTQGWTFWLDYDLTPRPGALRFSLGMDDLLGMVALHASVQFLRALGLEAIDAWTQHLSQLAAEDLRARGCTVITPSAPHLGPIVTFRLSDPDPDDPDALAAAEAETVAFQQFLAERGVRLTKHWDARRVPHLRISTHCYNTEDDVLQVGKLWEEHRA